MSIRISIHSHSHRVAPKSLIDAIGSTSLNRFSKSHPHLLSPNGLSTRGITLVSLQINRIEQKSSLFSPGNQGRIVHRGVFFPGPTHRLRLGWH